MTPRQQRAYVLDTNVLLYDPRAIYVFNEHDVIIPMTVIEEVDRFKKDVNETGRNARTVSRYLDELRLKGSLKEGVRLEGGGLLRVDYGPADGKEEISWGPDSADNRILATAMRWDKKPMHACLITRDTNMRLKSDALGVPAEDYQNAHIEVDEQYTGMVQRTVTAQTIDSLYANGSVPLDGYEDLFPHQFLLLVAEDSNGKTAMARVDHRRGKVRLVGRHKEGVWGIFARNKEQLFALDLLLDDSVQLVTINGVAGTGKTLLAIAAGLKQVADDARYRKLLVSRPIFPLGRDIGFLPGDIEQKLNPWMKPIFDNLELLFSTRQERNGHRSPEPEYQYLLDQKIIEVEPLTYIRGRSIPKQFLVVDEAQNLTPHEVKTVLTRAGEGTKVVMTGDPYQIDNPYVDALSNGLTYTIERFKRSEVSGHITLRKGERSELAELAAELL
ncbi:MAG: PhoH family protein [Alphaproteobacteria bacterium]|nr:PhoH family protein [Alphaproteobacteria bacterium]